MPLTLSLSRLALGQNLTTDETREAFDAIFEGKAPAEQIASFLVSLKDKGETVEEILGAVTSMRSRMIAVQAPAGAMDIVGTGGDAHSTLNISTAAAMVVAACGVKVT